MQMHMHPHQPQHYPLLGSPAARCARPLVHDGALHQDPRSRRATLDPASSPTAIFVTIPGAVPVEARAIAPAVAPSTLPVAPPAAAPAPASASAPRFRPNSFAIVIKCSPFVFYFLVFFQQRTRMLFLCSTRTIHTHLLLRAGGLGMSSGGPLPHTKAPAPGQAPGQAQAPASNNNSGSMAAVSRQGARKRVSAWTTFPSHADRRIASQCSFLPMLAFYF